MPVAAAPTVAPIPVPASSDPKARNQLSARKMRRAAAAVAVHGLAVAEQGEAAAAAAGGAAGSIGPSAATPSPAAVVAAVSHFNQGALAEARARAQALLDSATAAFDKRRQDKPTSDEKWMATVLRGGTMTDKVAAMALLIQQNPMVTLPTLDTLLNLAKKKSRRESQLAADSLFDLFQETLLPPDRELRRFGDHAGATAPAATAANLRFWLFEDLLKQRYRDFVTLMDSTLQDAMLHFKIATLKRAGNLASASPEMRRSLVTMIANRLGDVEKKVRPR